MTTVRSFSSLVRVAVAFVLCAAAARLQAQPTLTAPGTSNLGAGQVTLALQSNATGTGYFTLLEGAAPKLGTGAQTKAGKDGNGAAAARFGSLKLAANTVAGCTVGNLKAGTAYTVCFTADDGATLQGTVASGAFATPAVATLTGREWTGVGPERFSPNIAHNPSLTIAPDGRPWVVFPDGGYGNRATVRRFNGTTWELVGAPGFSDGAVDPVQLVFAPDGTPYVAYEDGAHGQSASVMKFTGTAWVRVGNAGFSGGRSDFVQLVIGPEGTLYVGYFDISAAYKATVMKFNGTNWEAVGGVGFSGVSVYYISLAIAPNGMPYMAFQSWENSGRASVMRFTGTAWELVGGAGFTPSDIGRLSLAIGPDGTPFLAFVDSSVEHRATVLKFSGSNWVPVGAAGFSTEGIDFPRLAIAPDGAPLLAFHDRSYDPIMTVMAYRGSTWTLLGSAGLGAGFGLYPILALAPDGTPFVAYEDVITESGLGVSNIIVKRLSVPVPTTYAEWVATNFSVAAQGQPEVTGPLADPDGAGVVNLQRFAHNLAPHGPVAAPAIYTIVSENGTQYPALQFNRLNTAPGLKYVVQASTDLVQWSDVSTWTAGAATRVTARDSLALGSAPRRFLRLQVTLP
ncbi:MAG: hypothetical protein IPL39_20805 [Opitutaceae bacterium]|nr:hypothetical protein [Opitutaceae bacterium]